MTITGRCISNTVSNTSMADYPVLRGLEGLRISGKEIAAILGISPPTYSKWRNGHGRITAARLVLLTLLLANWIDDMEADLKRRKAISRDRQSEIALKALRRCLALQEEANRALTQDEVREGSRLFRKWWLQKPAGSPGHDGRQAVA